MTRAGTKLGPTVPRPSSPYVSYPHDHTVPSDFKARLWVAPTEISLMPVSPWTCVRYGVIETPLNEVHPHPHTVPSDARARLWYPPAEMDATPVRLATW